MRSHLPRWNERPFKSRHDRPVTVALAGFAFLVVGLFLVGCEPVPLTTDPVPCSVVEVPGGPDASTTVTATCEGDPDGSTTVEVDIPPGGLQWLHATVEGVGLSSSNSTSTVCDGSSVDEVPADQFEPGVGPVSVLHSVSYPDPVPGRCVVYLSSSLPGTVEVHVGHASGTPAVHVWR